MFKLIFCRSSELQKLECALQKLHNDLSRSLELHDKRTIDASEDLIVELILMAHYAKEEINDRIVRNQWNTVNRTVFIDAFGKIPIAVALQFTVFRLYKIAHNIGVLMEISRILSRKPVKK